jgi:uncharacterized protein YndB with AHSA1/START domain
MITARAHVFIDRPIGEVFDYLADSRNEPAWLPGATRVAKTSPGPIALGTTFEGEYARAGLVTLELTEYARPERVTFRACARIVEFDDAVTLSPDGGGTRLEAVLRARPRGWMRLVEPLMGGVMRKQFEGNWTQLKRALEPANTRAAVGP